MDDEAWVERLRKAVASGTIAPTDAIAATNGAAPAAPEPSAAPSVEPPERPELDRAVAAALRDLEQRVAAIDIRLRQLNDERNRLVEDVADAVVARLDASRGGFSG